MSITHGALILGAMAGVFASGASAASKQFQRSFSVSPGGKLTIESDCGSIHIAGTSGSQVSVTANITGRDKDVARFEVTAEQQGADVQVKGKRSRSGSWLFNWSSRLDVKYVIEVPTPYDVRASSAGGDLEVSSIEGAVMGDISGGDVVLKAIKGKVEAATSGGDIRGEECAGKVRLKTSGGDIIMVGLTGDVDANTSGGNVKLTSVSGAVRAETSGGDVLVEVRGENRGIHAETSGGSITIDVPKDISANIDAGTSGGGIECDLPVTTSGRISESRIKGTVNGGGATIYAHTSGGDVRIKSAE